METSDEYRHHEEDMPINLLSPSSRSRNMGGWGGAGGFDRTMVRDMFAVCCSVLQCVALWCCVLLCGAV